MWDDPNEPGKKAKKIKLDETLLAIGSPKEGISVVYISRSCDHPKSESGGMATYAIKSCDFPKVKISRWVVYVIVSHD
jgi:hypothetical protein